jgi:hypothetical protein
MRARREYSSWTSTSTFSSVFDFILLRARNLVGWKFLLYLYLNLFIIAANFLDLLEDLSSYRDYLSAELNKKAYLSLILSSLRFLDKFSSSARAKKGKETGDISIGARA